MSCRSRSLHRDRLGAPRCGSGSCAVAQPDTDGRSPRCEDIRSWTCRNAAGRERQLRTPALHGPHFHPKPERTERTMTPISLVHHLPACRHAQRGATLLVGLIMLMLLTL